MKCPWCGSGDLVWDTERGEVICSKCGTVIDRIYVNQISGNEYEFTVNYNVNKRVKNYPKLSKYTLLYLKLLDKIKKSKRLKNVTIDSERFRLVVFKGAPQVKVLKRNQGSVNSIISRDKRIKAVLEVMLRFPRLYSRTDRAKVAIAMLALALALGRRINAHEVAEQVGVSVMHVRRLERLLRKEDEFINEVRRKVC